MFVSENRFNRVLKSNGKKYKETLSMTLVYFPMHSLKHDIVFVHAKVLLRLKV